QILSVIIRICLGFRVWDFRAGKSWGQRSFLVLQGMITDMLICVFSGDLRHSSPLRSGLEAKASRTDLAPQGSLP
ncbi:MAG: hypothetical protein U9Q63_00895, partial [Patescibacteria group bacterium]|nr:hypothetical protein [Patescibacteria group bacterium]